MADANKRTRRTLWARLVEPGAAVQGIEPRRQAQLLASFLLILLPLLIAGLALMPATLSTPGVSGWALAGVLGLVALALSMAYLLSRTRHYRVGALLALVGLAIVPIGGLLTVGALSELLVLSAFIWAAVPIILASVLLGLRGLLALGALNVATILLLLAVPQIGLAEIGGSLVFTVIVTALMAVVTRHRDELEQDRQAELVASNDELRAVRASLEERVAARTGELEQQAFELLQAKELAEFARQEAEHEREKAEFINQLNERLRGEQSPAMLADNIIRYLCERFNAQVGALFVVEGRSLELAGSYAYALRQEHPNRFEWGEGLVGQAAQDGRTIQVDCLPDSYLTITSSLGETRSRTLLILPFIYNGRVVGVIEMGALEELAPAQQELLEAALETIAIAFQTTRTRARINELLTETQQQAEELQAQQEELRVTNEELYAQARRLRKQEGRVQ